MNQDALLSYVLGIVLGLLAYVFYSSSLKSKGKTIITFKDGFSMKYHNFVWFFLLPIWAVSGLVDYAINFEDLNFFPFNLLLFIEFICVVLLVIAFVGFFRYTRYSWHCIIISIVLFTISITIEIIVFLSYSISFTAYDVGEYLGIYIPRLLTIVYYLKRRSVFSGDPIFIRKQNSKEEAEEVESKAHYFEENKEEEEETNKSASLNNEKMEETDLIRKSIYTKICYCRICGTKLDEGSKFCRKCGTKIEEKND